MHAMESRAIKFISILALVALLSAAFTVVALASPVSAASTRVQVIVQLQPGTNAVAVARQAQSQGSRITHIYDTAMQGFSGQISERALEGLWRSPHVALIEPDAAVTAADVQLKPDWGVDRLDQRELPLDGTYRYGPTGVGVAVYVLDTGIAPHPDFGTRLKQGFTAVADGRSTVDCNGHGTHVAGIIAGATYGVAKGASLIPVRVLGCDAAGQWSDVIAGLDWMVANHPAGASAIANLSLSGRASRTVDAAVARAISAGIAVTVAAGNDGGDACKTSPGRVPGALTVAATDRSDNRPPFSGYGSCVDLFAPGVDIRSAWLEGGNSVLSGTSMAAPHVAGVAALLATQGVTAPSDIAVEIVSTGTSGVVTNAGKKSPNLLLYSSPM